MAANPAGEGGSRPRKDRPKVQAQRLERLERRKEAGKDINEERLEKLAAKAGPGGKWYEKAESAIANEGFFQHMQLLSGPNEDTSLLLLDYLRENPEYATQVREWLAANKGEIAGAGGLQTQMFERFPELKRVYLNATGSWIPDAEGNLVYDYRGLGMPGGSWSPETGWVAGTEGKYTGGGEGTWKDSPLNQPRVRITAPPNPTDVFAQVFENLDDESLYAASDAVQQMLLARQRRAAYDEFAGDYFTQTDIEGVE